MNIEQLAEQFKTVEELRVFCSSQFRQITQLAKKNKDLEEQVSELKKNGNTLQLLNKETTSVLESKLAVEDDAKSIAQIQLKLLKASAFDRELTKEEAQKVQIYNDILNKREDQNKKTLKADAKVVDSQDLLKLVDTANE